MFVRDNSFSSFMNKVTLKDPEDQRRDSRHKTVLGLCSLDLPIVENDGLERGHGMERVMLCEWCHLPQSSNATSFAKWLWYLVSLTICNLHGLINVDYYVSIAFPTKYKNLI